MASTAATKHKSELPQPTNGSRVGEPVWDIALCYPPQGSWSEEDYLELAHGENWMVEFSDGKLEFLPMPPPRHGRLTRYLVRRMEKGAEERGEGEVFTAPIPVWLWSDKYREPDIFYCLPHRIPDPDKPPRGADLAVEIVSGGKQNWERDWVKKKKTTPKRRSENTG